MTDAHGHGGSGQIMDTFNGPTHEEIDRLVQEYVGMHRIVDSPDPTKRMSFPNRREDELGKVKDGLEGIIGSTMGNKIFADKPTADHIIELLVTKGYELDHMKLPEDPKAKEQKVSEYLARAGVDYTQLVKQITSTRRPTKIDQLPEDHPLRRLVTYLQHQSHESQRRLDYIQQRLVSLGEVQAVAVAEAFNKYAGLRLDKRYAKPQEALQSYAAIVQADRLKYENNAPEKVHNVALKPAA